MKIVQPENMKMFLSICIFICVVSANYGDVQNYCLPIQPISQDGVVLPRPEVIQGHPGKTGPRGPIGPKGSQGIPGECGCNPSEIEQLRMEMQRMNGKFITCCAVESSSKKHGHSKSASHWSRSL